MHLGAPFGWCPDDGGPDPRGRRGADRQATGLSGKL